MLREMQENANAPKASPEELAALAEALAKLALPAWVAVSAQVPLPTMVS